MKGIETVGYAESVKGLLMHNFTQGVLLLGTIMACYVMRLRGY